METKICIRCGEEKELSEFEFRKNRGTFETTCRKCRTIYKKKYRQNNKEKIRKEHKKYYQKNKERVCASSNTYYQNNKEKIRKEHKKYYQKNKEKITDVYLANIFKCNLKELKQQSDLIKLKRLHIQIQRELKQK